MRTHTTSGRCSTAPTCWHRLGAVLGLLGGIHCATPEAIDNTAAPPSTAPVVTPGAPATPPIDGDPRRHPLPPREVHPPVPTHLPANAEDLMYSGAPEAKEPTATTAPAVDAPAADRALEARQRRYLDACRATMAATPAAPAAEHERHCEQLKHEIVTGQGPT